MGKMTRGSLQRATTSDPDTGKTMFLAHLAANGGFVGPALDAAGATWAQFKQWKHRDPEFRDAVTTHRQMMFEKSLDLVQAGINGELGLDVKDQLALAIQFLRLSKDISREEARADAKGLIAGTEEIKITIHRK
jgi:hypothetical protein